MNGYCKKHGEVKAWTVCRHITTRKARNIVLESSDTALCFSCAPRLYELDIDDLATVCEECLKNFVRKLVTRAQSKVDLNEIVIGLERINMNIYYLDPDNPILV